MIDPAQIILAVIAFFSLLFIALTEGLKHTIGYRGSEETRRRKERIDGALYNEVVGEINQYVWSDECKKDDENKKIERFQELGYRAYVAENITGDILDRSNRFIERFFKVLLGAGVLLVIVAYFGINSDLTQVINSIIFVAYLIVAGYYLWTAISALRKCYVLRNNFVLLDENSTLENAVELFDKLTKEKLI